MNLSRRMQDIAQRLIDRDADEPGPHAVTKELIANIITRKSYAALKRLHGPGFGETAYCELCLWSDAMPARGKKLQQTFLITVCHNNTHSEEYTIKAHSYEQAIHQARMRYMTKWVRAYLTNP
jgi:hypothetical protein